jgi:hypothetical protein
MLPVFSVTLNAQAIQLNETIILSASPFKKNVNQDALKTFFVKEVSPIWHTAVPGTELFLLQADRGVGKDEFLLACMPDNPGDQDQILPVGSPFTDKIFSTLGPSSSNPSEFITNPKKFTKYRLIGADGITQLPEVDILGIHYIQIRKDKSDAFEHFVEEQLHPNLTRLLPDMGLFYYKAVEGENSGSFITIFAINSVEARENFWPTGGSETDVVKNAFLPYKGLARDLGNYLVEGSYLLPESGGAAAFFESLKWTDFIVVK